MKRVKFIRHSELEHPYDDYSHLTFNQICGLATGRLSPGIHTDSQKMLIEKLNTKELKSFDLILCSQSRRTIQTAILIRKLSGKQMKIKKTANLSEIYFDPSVLISKDEFTKHGLSSIRISVFHGMKDNTGAESLDEVLNHAQKLKDELKMLPHDNILCITHSFYMRVIRLFFLDKLTASRTISVKKLMNTIDHNYLEGFEIEL